MNRIKKHRGLRRYYKNLATENELHKATWLNFENSEIGLNNIHLHFDLKGYGNESFKRRKPHLDKLFRHFELLVDKANHLKIDFQLYAIILDWDSCSDALFLQTPNPKNSQTPFKIVDLQTTTTFSNQLLNDYISNLKGYEKLYGQADEAFCLLFKKNVGTPF